MKKRPVVFVGSLEYTNLGIGYMAALLSEAGFETIIIDLRNSKEEILEIVKGLNPLLIGFSVIYQYHIEWFIDLALYLRKNGINSHFTAGGHYASLRYEELFRFIPSLDSIVRFEGEYTLPELVKLISIRKEWRNIKSIAYKSGRKIIANTLRPLERDLDKFPYPFRAPLTEYAFHKKFATILAGRGCVYNCSFCNQKEFYRQPPGPVKRIRKPEMVVKEMAYLFHEKECSIFLIDDDDFPVKTSGGSEWIVKFCNELSANGLKNQIIWKINCRPDEVDEEIFRMMKRSGLFLVFLGIEDGTDSGLKRLNKQMTAGRCLEGINTLRKLEIDFDYGFMLFQPVTTYMSLNENLEYLKQICGDGYTPATFLKMMPYYESRLEKELKKEGRIKGKPGFFDYDFMEESMNHYYEFLIYCFNEWLRDPGGLVNVSKWARNYISVFPHYYKLMPEVVLLSKNVKTIISESNLFLLDNMKELAAIFRSGKYNNGNFTELMGYRENILIKHNQFITRINNSMITLLRIAEDQKNLRLVFN